MLDAHAVLIVGYESPIDPLTQDRNLPFVTVLGKTLLAHGLDSLIRSQFKSIVVLCPEIYSDTIQDKVGSMDENEMEITVRSPQQEESPVEAIASLVKDGLLTTDTLIIPANLVTDLSFPEMMRRFYLATRPCEDGADAHIMVCMSALHPSAPQTDNKDQDANVWVTGTAEVDVVSQTRPLVWLSAHESFNQAEKINVSQYVASKHGTVTYTAYRRPPHAVVLNVAALQHIIANDDCSGNFDHDLLPYLAHQQSKPGASSPRVHLVDHCGAAFLGRVGTRWSYIETVNALIKHYGASKDALFDVPPNRKGSEYPDRVEAVKSWIPNPHVNALPLFEVAELEMPEKAALMKDLEGLKPREKKKREKAIDKALKAAKNLKLICVRSSYVDGTATVEWAPEDPAASIMDLDDSVATVVQSSVIMPGASVGPRCTLDGVIVCENGRVGAGCRLVNCIVGPGAVVEPGTDNRASTERKQAFVNIAQTARV
ncbi:Nucleotidyl transferase [Carpediemonas membranifera]|uniref:Translation initiation factor eIF2B subunit gamma n=1 Tax=Carpediemonas membranifera TaxID=201153 RepID=A0A8J6B9I2_9EUKA|nr:Nucleotidyl transferase [Carpediemonas membranifera]|eukprot:KAG9396994.1 Nucleotidyl transferase [Carpediemonas membranifera]